MSELKEKVQKVMDEIINPALAQHGGYAELIDVKDNTVILQLSGGCHGCASAAMTLKMGVEATLREEVSPDIEVVDATDHSAGRSPYF
ncbi:MAG: NifU family protein [Candidatus Omnitrophota bacterium]